MSEMTFKKKLSKLNEVTQHKGGALLSNNRTGSPKGNALQDNRPVQRKQNNTGIPDNLKAGVESLSGMSMDHVKVHYNSAQPAQLNAHAYAQGSNIHLAPGQERHLPHEAWHIVQQAQGRVASTVQMKNGLHANQNAGLEAEADFMGKKALGQFRKGVVGQHAKNNFGRRSETVLQFYQYQQPNHHVRMVTFNPLNGAPPIQWEEALQTSVEYNAGDLTPALGTPTEQPALWQGSLFDDGTHNAATQLHGVNRWFGGLGEPGGGNIFPGSQGLNQHHRHAENRFAQVCFGMNAPPATVNQPAITNATYEVTAQPHYGAVINQQQQLQHVADPDLTVNIHYTDANNQQHQEQHPVIPGPGFSY